MMLAPAAQAYRMEESSVEPLLYTFLMFEMIISCACMVDSVHVILWSIDTFSATAELGWLNILLHWAWHLTLTLFLGIVVGLTAGVLVTLYFRWLSHRAAEYKYLEAGMLLIVPFVVYWGCEVINKAQATVQVCTSISLCHMSLPLEPPTQASPSYFPTASCQQLASTRRWTEHTEGSPPPPP